MNSWSWSDVLEWLLGAARDGRFGRDVEGSPVFYFADGFEQLLDSGRMADIPYSLALPISLTYPASAVFGDLCLFNGSNHGTARK